MSRLIGLAGYGRVGKDTVAQTLVDAGFTRVAFADVIRDMLLDVNPWIDTLGSPVRLATVVGRYGWDAAKDDYPEVRRLLQAFGTASRDVHGRNVWLDALFDRLPAGDVVISDVRFPHEAAAIIAAGGQVWRIHRHGYGPVNAHPSETAMDGWRQYAWHVWNNSSHASLAASIRADLGLLV